MRKKYYFLFTLILTILLFFSLSTFSIGYPKLVNKLMDAFDKIESYIVAISTPVAAVSLGAGFLIQKFSFGDDERIRMGKKLVRTTIVSYVFILLLDLIVSAIKSLVT